VTDAWQAGGLALCVLFLAIDRPPILAWGDVALGAIVLPLFAGAALFSVLMALDIGMVS
jgi:hypothetical protein